MSNHAHDERQSDKPFGFLISKSGETTFIRDKSVADRMTEAGYDVVYLYTGYQLHELEAKVGVQQEQIKTLLIEKWQIAISARTGAVMSRKRQVCPICGKSHAAKRCPRWVRIFK